MPGLVGGFGKLNPFFCFNKNNIFNLFHLSRAWPCLSLAHAWPGLCLPVKEACRVAVKEGKDRSEGPKVRKEGGKEGGKEKRLYNCKKSVLISNLDDGSNFDIQIGSKSNCYTREPCKSTNQLGAYLAGLIEGDGTFAIHNTDSTAAKYRPMIVIVFKKADLPLAQFLQNITKCGNIYIKKDRGYVLWQIQDIVSVFTIVNLINGKMRTPKIEALKRTIDWLNKYIELNKLSNLPKTNLILSKIHQI